MVIDFVRLATPRNMTRDAYTEFCWGLGLPEVPDGYAVLYGHGDDGSIAAAVLDDVDYARLLVQSEGVVVPGGKAVAVLDDWPDLRQDAASVWG